jgi:hypothetical protein
MTTVTEEQVEAALKTWFCCLPSPTDFELFAGDMRRVLEQFAASAPVEDDWRDDPATDERWQAGLEYAMERLCELLGVDQNSVTWDAATETLNGDVMAVICNILQVKYGEDWSPSAPAQQGESLSINEFADLLVKAAKSRGLVLVPAAPAQEMPAASKGTTGNPEEAGQGAGIATSAPASAPAQGDWVMVPREPTQKMWNAGAAVLGIGGDTVERIYRAMLAAAPAPVSDDVKAERDALIDLVYEVTSLSPMEDDGSHWCKISKAALENARAALRARSEP